MKKKHQSAPHGGEGYSTESYDEKPPNGSGTGSSRDCKHIKKSVDPNSLRKNLKVIGIVSETCSECAKASKTQPTTPPASEDEGSESFEYDKTLWLCLKCGKQLCGRLKNQHALKHYETPHTYFHSMAMNTTTYEIWCYSCDEEVSASTCKSLQECVELVKKLQQKPPPAPAIPLHGSENSIDAIQGKIAATLEHIRPLLPMDQQQQTTANTTENNNGVVYGPSPPPPPPPIPGMAKRVQGHMGNDQTMYRPPTSLTTTTTTTTDYSSQKNPQQLQLPRVRGLTNLGNTCFFNAVMQCLAQTPFLLDVLKESSEPGEEFILPGGSFKFNKDEDVELPPIKGTLNSWGGLTSALAQTLEELQSGGGVFNPCKLFDKLCAKCPQFCGGDQHDSHELLRHLLESVRSDDLKRYQKVILQNIGYYDQDTNNVSEDMKKKCKIYGQQAGDRILRPEQVFRGFLVSTLRCQDCVHTSSRHENFLDMSLPVSVEKPQPPKRRKNSPENVPQGHSKHQLKKESKAKRSQKYQQKKQQQQLNSAYSMETNSSGSEQSDADVEDNLNDDTTSGTATTSKVTTTTTTAASGAAVATTTAVPSNYVSTCDPNGNNSNELPSPLVPEKRGDSPENPNKDSLDDDENGIATSPANASVSVQDRFLAKGGNGDGVAVGGDGVVVSVSNNKLIEVGISEKGASLVRQLSLSTTSMATPSQPPMVNGEINDSLSNEMDKLHLTSEATAQAAASKRAKAKRVRTQSYSDWSTTIAPRYQCDDGECSVQSCLNNFTAVELMTGNNKVGCDNCTKRINGEGGKTIYTNATKQFLISSPPAVLILHLKRFQIGQRCIFSKLTRHVEFPMVLDIAPFCGSKVKNLPNIDRKQKKLVYALYGIVEHSGGMYGGHYTAYVKVRPQLKPDDRRWKFIPQGSKAELDQADEQLEKLEELLAKEKARDLRMKANDSDDFSTSCSSSEPEVENDEEPEPSPCEEPNITPPPGKWYYVSDSRVQEATEQQVLTAQAYLLFYERIY
ncbi:ubiquitin carboxyl-terminal hydrolase 16 isoform X2 [Eupeodes corollae]|uniref:ubiquitin carboxyl-terminal hydrolase 16 isoform X2 n=1 Tax=Eupeodes corollae TaxID=290404 RepID=UPI0024929287|nr:ubiquitin carboxyl-terminal hydrolase 16 isoform X2 [Eupeodes corollae]